MVGGPAGFSLFHCLPKRAALLLMLLIPALASLGQESSVLMSEEGSVTLRWESDASLFRIRIRRDGQVFLDKEHGSNEIRLNLAPGIYEYKISTLNSFAKEDSSTAWLPLRVRSSRIPHFRLVSHLDIAEGEGGKTLVVESTKFREDTSLHLIKSDKRIGAEWQRDGNRYLVRLPDSLEAGRWNLEARDISGKTFTVPKVLTVHSAEALSIHSLSAAELPSGEIFPIEIVGEGFDKGMSLSFERAGEALSPVSTEVFSNGRALIYLDLTGAAPGDYALIAGNPNGTQARFEGALRVEPAKESGEAEAVKIKPRVEFHAGYSPMILLFNSSEQLPVYLAVDIALLLQSGWEAPFLRGLGAEVRIFGGISGLGFNENAQLIFGLDASIYYRPVLGGPVAPVFLVGAGLVQSNYAAVARGINVISVLRTGIGMDIVRNRWVTRIGVGASISFDENTFLIYSLMLRQGLRY